MNMKDTRNNRFVRRAFTPGMFTLRCNVRFSLPAACGAEIRRLEEVLVRQYLVWILRFGCYNSVVSKHYLREVCTIVVLFPFEATLVFVR